MKILHIIIGLNVGGAELMLMRLIKSHKGRLDFSHSVISITTVGKVGAQLQEMGVEVHALGMGSILRTPRKFCQLMRLIRAGRPDIVQTWMYHADLLGGLAARLAGIRSVIWGVRGSAIPQSGVSVTQLVIFLCSWLSRFIPKVIVCCSEPAQFAHAEKGYDPSKMVVIHNGFELSHFNKNSLLRQQSRAAFGFGNNEVVIGIVGRFDRLKDHKNFVLASSIVGAKFNYVKFLMVGRNLDSTNTVLKGWLDESGLTPKFVLAGERSDVPNCLAAMDVFCLSSSEEGFPNVVCEAMAMNVPCVVTNAGNAADIVSNTGIVVAPRDSTALAGALQFMITKGDTERSRLGELARRRIQKNYSIEIVTARFELLYELILDGRPLASSVFFGGMNE
jgi:glycosyltransferase involved in cell wall biosynthesis